MPENNERTYEENNSSLVRTEEQRTNNQTVEELQKELEQVRGINRQLQGYIDAKGLSVELHSYLQGLTKVEPQRKLNITDEAIGYIEDIKDDIAYYRKVLLDAISVMVNYAEENFTDVGKGKAECYSQIYQVSRLKDVLESIAKNK